MSHFCGLVILTPEYAQYKDMDESLDKYWEELEVPEYRTGDVTDFDKVTFLSHYLIENKDGEVYNAFRGCFVEFMKDKDGYVTPEKFMEDYNYKELPTDRYQNYLISENKDKFVEFFKQEYPEMLDKFEETYEEHGESWNYGNWHKEAGGTWGEYSAYNPDSKWDWYQVGGRWDKSIKTKSGEFVNECKFGDIDFAPYPDEAFEDAEDVWGKPYKALKEGYEWHFDNKYHPPFCVVIDGKWYQKGEMGWFGIASNEKSDWEDEFMKLMENIPDDSEVYCVDFHI